MQRAQLLEKAIGVLTHDKIQRDPTSKRRTRRSRSKRRSDDDEEDEY